MENKLNIYKIIFMIVCFVGLTGCDMIPDSSVDTSLFQYAVISGEPVPFSSLPVGEVPEAVRCRSVWEEDAGSLSKPADELIKENQDVILKISRKTNDFNQTLTEYHYENQLTGESWSEYYINKQIIYRSLPQSEDNFYPHWIGRGLILFRSENKSIFFFLLDTGSRTISLFHDCQWKHIPMDRGAVTNDIWQYYDPSMKVQLGGYEEKTGQIFFYVEHEWTTLFEYNPLWPNDVTVLLDNLPAQVSEFTNYSGRGKLFQRSDGNAWFCVETGGEPGRSGLVFRYNAKSKILTPVFQYSDEQNCYFYKDSIAIHKWPDIALFDYNTNMIYPLEDCSEMYVTSEIGPAGKECIKTYSETEKRHYLWDVSGGKRYYVTYDDMVVNFPDADHMTRGDKIVYSHGEGRFYLEKAEDNRYLYDGYRIDWYSTIRKNIIELDEREGGPDE